MSPQDDWPVPPNKPRRTVEEEQDWSMPVHQPPMDQTPQTYQTGSPAVMTNPDLDTSEVLAVIAAAIPGLGQMMLGQTVKGLVLLGVAIFTCSGFGLFSVASIIDAFMVAKAKKRRTVGEWEFFPDFQDTFNL